MHFFANELASENGHPFSKLYDQCAVERTIDWNVVQFGMRLPVLVENEQQLLRAPQRERRDQAATSTANNLVHKTRESAMKQSFYTHNFFDGKERT